MNKRSTKDCWDAFRMGDHVSTHELKRMLGELEAALPFLMENPDYSPRVAQMDAATIRSILSQKRAQAVAEAQGV